MNPYMLVAVLILPAAVGLAPTGGADGACPVAPPGPVPAPSVVYVEHGFRSGYNRVEVGGGPSVEERIVGWQRGAWTETWRESNGMPGLQKPHDCSTPDTLVARTYTGTGGGSITA